jgi:KUP system potassium uptake protein
MHRNSTESALPVHVQGSPPGLCRYISPYIAQVMFKNEILYEENILVSIRITDHPFGIQTRYARDLAQGLLAFMITAGYMEIFDIIAILRKDN